MYIKLTHQSCHIKHNLWTHEICKALRTFPCKQTWLGTVDITKAPRLVKNETYSSQSQEIVSFTRGKTHNCRL